MDSTLNQQSSFTKLIQILNSFQIQETIISEKDLESKLEHYLKKCYLEVERQKIFTNRIRNDIVCKIGKEIFCLELKKFADLSCVEQLDKYLPHYKDGVILVCWKASTNLKEVFRSVKSQIKTPVELIEVRRNQCIV